MKIKTVSGGCRSTGNQDPEVARTALARMEVSIEQHRILVEEQGMLLRSVRSDFPLQRPGFYNDKLGHGHEGHNVYAQMRGRHPLDMKQ